TPRSLRQGRPHRDRQPGGAGAGRGSVLRPLRMERARPDDSDGSLPPRARRPLAMDERHPVLPGDGGGRLHPVPQPVGRDAVLRPAGPNTRRNFVALAVVLLVLVGGVALYGLTAMNPGPFSVGSPPSASSTPLP